METLPNYYILLFRAVENAISAIDGQNYGLARELLIAGQQAAEEAYLRMEE